MTSPVVLVVDDVEDTRLMYTQSLLFHGFRVLEAADGHGALRQVHEHLPDVVVMDLSLPGIDGWEATRQIKADPRTQHIPVLAVTGVPDAAATPAGFADVFTKPCLPTKVVSKVRELLNQGRT